VAGNIAQSANESGEKTEKKGFLGGLFGKNNCHFPPDSVFWITRLFSSRMAFFQMLRTADIIFHV